MPLSQLLLELDLPTLFMGLILVFTPLMLLFLGIRRIVRALESIADSLNCMPAVQQERMARMQRNKVPPRRATN